MSPIEGQLRHGLRTGTLVDLAPDVVGLGRDSTPEQWAHCPAVDADFLLSLLTSERVEGHPRGLALRGARVEGDLDWAWQRLLMPLKMRACQMEQPWSLYAAELRGLEMEGCQTRALNARLLTVEGEVRLIDNHFGGTLTLTDARLRGSLVMHGSHAHTDSVWQGRSVAVLADRINVGGSVALARGFTADALVSLRSAKIGGTLYGEGATLDHPKGVTLAIAGMRVAGDLRLSNGFVSNGRVMADGLLVEGSVVLSKARLNNPGKDAINLDHAKIDGSLVMDAAQVKGRMTMVSARIGGSISLEDTSLLNPDGDDALWANSVDVEGNVFLRNGFAALGQIRMINAHVGRSLVCSKASFDGGKRHALAGHGLSIAAEADFRDSRISGTLSLAGATVGASVLLEEAKLTAAAAPSLQFTSINVGDSIGLQKASVQGEIRLDRAVVGADLDLSGASLSPATKPEEGTTSPLLTLAGGNVGARLRLRRMTLAEGTIDLGGASTNELDDDAASWPQPGSLVLNNFTFTRLSRHAPRSPEERIDWARRQSTFTPDPYRQLVTLYHHAGQPDDATTVAIAQQDDLLASSELRGRERLWRRFLAWSVRHGYRPGRAAAGLAAIYLLTIAGVAFGVSRDAFIQVGNTAPQPGVRASACDAGYPCISVPVYALETIVPIVNFHQAENWQPDASSAEGKTLRAWLFLSTVAGYLGSTLLVATATGVLERKLAT